MGNADNLKPYRFKKGEARTIECSKKGNRAKEAKRKRKLTMQEAVTMALDRRVSDKAIQDKLREAGIQDDDMIYSVAIALAAVGKAADGDIYAAEYTRDTAGDDQRTLIKQQDLDLRREELKLKQQEADRRAERESQDEDTVVRIIYDIPDNKEPSNTQEPAALETKDYPGQKTEEL